MPADPAITARTTDQPGRFVVSVRANHFVADATEKRGGAGEAPTATEWMLTSLASCGLAVITDEARKRRIPASAITVDSTATQDPQDRTRFSRVTMHWRFAGCTQAQADELVRAFTDVCPIYNTIARTTPMEVWGEAV